MAYSTIITEGGLLPADVLDAIAAAELPGQKPEDFGLERTRNLSDRISAAWQAVRGQWALFQSRLANLRDDDAATTLTRERWIVPFLEALDYAPERNRSAYVVDGRTYAISHRAGEADDTPPIHVEGIRASLDARPPSGRPRLSPHALMQEYLNSTEQLWGIVTNGERLRLLRDSSRFTRPTYVEFDLRSMMEGENYSDFSLLYRLLHRSRLPGTPQRHRDTEDGHTSSVPLRLSGELNTADVDPKDCLLEQYHQQAVETGGRVREKLRDGVEIALKTLGNGLLSHPANADLRAKLADGKLPALGYYRQLLKLVYRLLFLMVAEERGLIATGTRRMTTTDDDPFEVSSVQSLDALLSRLVAGPSTGDRLQIYYEHYSLARLRRLAEAPGAGRGPFDDLWIGLQTTFRLLEGSDEQNPRSLGLAPLDGDLFGPDAIADLEHQQLRNADLLGAIRALSLYREKESKTLRRVNYGALDVEELGSVYESLLDFRPVIYSPQRHGDTENQNKDSVPLRLSASVVRFDLVTGTERKTTGSYYTRPELVQELIKSALVPVIEDRLKALEHAPQRHGDTENRKNISSVPQRLSGEYDSPQRHRDTEDVKESQRLSASVARKEEAILSIRVVDPACGSGHFLLAAARRLGRELARIRSGEEQPTPTDFRRAVRDVIRRCIFGVDLNPLAVDLCKLALWIEGHNAGMPLSFLDHHIKHGNSLIGATRALVEAGIPDEAYKPVTGDDKKVASEIRKRNKQERELHEKGMQQPSLFDDTPDTHDLAGELRQLDEMTGATVADVRAQARRYRQIVDETETERTLFNLWTAAFFQPLTAANARYVPTSRDITSFKPAGEKALMAAPIADEVRFFHWELEFPQVFSPQRHRDTEDGINKDSVPQRLSGEYDPPQRHRDTEGIKESLRLGASVVNSNGFDVVLGNPPWERIKLQEQEHFVDVAEIAQAANKAAREKAIQHWRAGTPQQQARIAEFDIAKQRAEAESRFVRASGRFPLTAVGDVNTYALFAEHARNLINGTGRAGIIVPTGIATDDTTKAFFGDLNAQRQLASLYDFENRENIFPAVDSRMKFCTLTIGATQKPARFAFFATNISHIADEQRVFTLTPEDIALINPNTRTAPVFRTRADAELTKKIYGRVPVLARESAPQRHRDTEEKDSSDSQCLSASVVNNAANPWGVSFMRMFDMSNDSGLFKNEPGTNRLPLYEGKMVQAYDHRAANVVTNLENLKRPGQPIETSLADHMNATFSPKPQYWISAKDVMSVMPSSYNHKWFLGFKSVTSPTNERTFINTLLPWSGVGNSMPVMTTTASASGASCLLATMNAIVLDYVAKQKVGGVNLNFFIVEQLPILPPTAFSAADIAFIVPRVLELVYTAWDMQPFAQDVWNEADEHMRSLILARRMANHTDTETHSTQEIKTLCLSASVVNSVPPPPFIWHDQRRALIRAELDARIARLYGLSRDELRYILDPRDVYGPDFPGETFRVLKEKELKLYGEYRTRRLVLEAWDREGG